LSPELIQKRRWEILGVLVLSLLVVVLDTSILNVALKTLAEPKPKGLGASQEQLEWATNAYTLAFAGLLFTWSILGDRLGRKRILLGGMIAFGISSALCAYATSPTELILFRALMGISGAAVMPTTVSIISNVFEPKERGKAFGIWAGAVGVALAIGPITGGLLLAHFWWGSVFLINVPIVIVAVALMIRLVPDSRNPSPGRLDPLGVVLSVIGITVFVFGIVRGGDLGWGSTQALVALAIGVGVLVAFVLWERRYVAPILDTKLFANARFSAGALIVMLLFCAYMGLVFVLSFYFQAARGYSPLHSGAQLLPLAIGQIIFSSRSSELVRRFGPRLVITGGMALMAASFLYYTQAGANSPVLPLLVVLFLQGMAVGMVMPPITTSLQDSVPRQRAGEASAISNTSRQVGGALGVAVIGAVLASAYRSGIDPHLAALPALAHHPSAVGTVGASITATLAFAQHVGPAGHALIAPAVSSFIHGMHEAAICSVVISGVAALAAAIWMPTRAALAVAVRQEETRVGAPAGAPDTVSVTPIPIEA
jgi:MFS transporter, DHA2 family, multidrug resistance protein